MEVFTISEVAKYLSVSRSTLYRLIGSGSFPAGLKVSPRRIVWKKSVVDDWFDQLPVNKGS